MIKDDSYLDEFHPLEVKVYGNDSEGAARRFKMLIQKEQILIEYKARQSYEKPSVKKRRKKQEAVKRRVITELREKQILSGEFERRQKAKEIKRQKKVLEKQMRNIMAGPSDRTI